jgi:hypothetical protein
MALHFGETQTAKEYAALFRKGKAFIEKKCFNGRYFHQYINLKDKTILEPYKKYDRKFGSCEAFYWNTEHRELKYQIGSGCHCDQVIAQWHANICGLGEIFDPVKVKKSLHSIFRNNFKKPLRDFTNACRIYGLNDEAGLVICTWPKGGKPAVPIMYADETMHGFEYQAAVHMIQTGMVAEGLEVVKAVRDRYDGERRNPWNEFECGSNYARSMASYALLPALSGFQFDMTKNHIGFAPRISGKRFQCFWSLNSGWGTYEKTGNTITLTILHGTLTLKSFQDSLLQKSGIVKTNKGKWEKEVKKIVFKEPLVLGAGHTLEISTNTI